MAMPKSRILTVSDPSGRLAAGLMSRWTMRASCALCRPASAWAPMRSTTSGGRGPTASMRCWRSFPWRRSIAMYEVSVSASVPASSTCTMCSLSIALAARASRRRRFTPSLPGRRWRVLRTLIATRSCVVVCSASYTEPIPPSPRRRTSLYLRSIVWPINRSAA
ncbi:hypothetical protein BE20_34340 [Sorangium cellulosum]|nr:hypothetical protein BE20_34340 [Sorangium cellulosum]